VQHIHDVISLRVIVCPKRFAAAGHGELKISQEYNLVNQKAALSLRGLHTIIPRSPMLRGGNIPMNCGETTRLINGRH
jgi:hypothetical protein